MMYVMDNESYIIVNLSYFKFLVQHRISFVVFILLQEEKSTKLMILILLDFSSVVNSNKCCPLGEIGKESVLG